MNVRLTNAPEPPKGERLTCSSCITAKNGNLLVRLPYGKSSTLFLCPPNAKENLKTLYGKTVNMEEAWKEFKAMHRTYPDCPFAQTGK